MNTILLQPTDVLFFRDGRPMGGASSGHGAAWPLPSVISHAFHAALHRADFSDVHQHRRGRSGHYEEHAKNRKFGSLKTAGPFPVCTVGDSHTWFFPHPLDADDSGASVIIPFQSTASSSLNPPCKYPVGSTVPPSKVTPKTWWSAEAWNEYLSRIPGQPKAGTKTESLKNDRDFSDTEHHYGIGISDDTNSVMEGQFYSAHYLRLKDEVRLGVLAQAEDKDFEHQEYGKDLVIALLNGRGTEIIAGGQQRVCTATLDVSKKGQLPLPHGMVATFEKAGGKWLVKWVLLTPAIFPAIGEHQGGWLPSWISHTDGKVLLKAGDDHSAIERQPGERRDHWRERVKNLGGIAAHLVASIVGKPIPVTGWALANNTDRSEGGAKSTHLAVPAGSVYYFECDSAEAAAQLAAALNWHGSETASGQIKNRRSTLMGEKGFGLGVCSTWNFHPTSSH